MNRNQPKISTVHLVILLSFAIPKSLQDKEVFVEAQNIPTTILIMKRAEILKSTVDTEREVQEKLAEKQLEMLKEVRVILKKKANDKGHLFEQIHMTEISTSLKEQAKIEIEEKYLSVENPIKEIGEHLVLAQVGKNKGKFTLVVEA